MAVPPIVLKLALTAATDKRTWKAVAVLIAAVLMPFILTVLIVCSLFAGTSSANRDLLDYSFKNKWMPVTFTAEQRTAIKDMRSQLDELDKAMEKYEDSLDGDLVKAVFYCLNFGGELDEDFDYTEFCVCFDDLSLDDFDEIAENLSEEFPQYSVNVNLKFAAEKVCEYLKK